MPSRAYGSTCSFSNSKPPLSESKTAEYIKDREKVLSELDLQSTVQDEVRRNLIVSGGFPQAKVEEKLSTVGKLPDELCKAWLDMQRSAVKMRLSQDEDFMEMMSADEEGRSRMPPCENYTSMTSNLKKLYKN